MGKRFDYEYIVIGGGVAGTTVAKQLAAAQRKVALIDQKDLTSVADGVTYIKGRAEFAGRYDLNISGQEKPVSASKFVIATGTELDTGTISGVDSVPYYAPETVFELKKAPKTVLVVGAGTSGCEAAQHLAKMGAKVVIVELSARLLPREDEEVGKVLQQYFDKRFGVKTFTSTRVTALERDKVSLRVVFMRGGQEHTVRVEKVVLATGRKPATNLGLANIGVSFDKNGIIVDKTFQTSGRNVYAVGDVIGGEGSTERAVYSAELAAMNMLGRNKNFANFSGFMRVTRTEPEVATVGLSEDELTKRARKYRKIMLPLSAIPAAKLHHFKIGFLKMLVDHQNKVLGATMVGPCADEVLQEVALAIRHNLSLVEIASTPHVAESWSNLIKTAARQLVNAKK